MSQPTYTILIVDGAAEDRTLYRDLLHHERELTYQFVEFDCGEAALHWCQTATPDVILLNDWVPNWDGLTILRRLQQQRPDPLTGDILPLPVVLLTPQENTAVAVEAIKNGAQDYLAKDTLTADLLCRTVRHVIERMQLLAQIRQQRAQQDRSDEQLRLAMDFAQIGSWDWDLETHQISWNEHHYHIFGLVPNCAEPSYTLWRDRVHPNDLEGIETALKQAIQTGTRYQEEYRVVWDDGSVHWVVSRGQTLEDATGKPIRMLGVVIDISDRKQVELTLEQGNAELERRVVERTTELQAALRDREQVEVEISRLAAIVESSNDAIISKSLDGTILSWNRGAELLFGYSAAEAIGQPVTLFVPPDRYPEVLGMLQRIKAGERVPSFETVRQCKDGRFIEIAVTVSPIKDATGKVIAASAIKRDITARKQAEQALRNSEARYRAIVEDQTELICRFLPDSTILFVNTAYCRYFGLQAEDVLHKSYQPVVYAADQEQVGQLVNSMSRENPTVLIENRVVVNGEVRWTQWINRMLFDEHGQFVEYQSVGRDITALKRAELERQAASNRLNFLLKNSPVVIFSCKPEGDYGATFISENAKAVLGYAASDFLADPKFWLQRLHPDDTQRVLSGLDHLFNDGFYAHEYRFLRADGTYCWVLAQLRLIRNGAGQPVEMLGYLVDISDRKAVEESLRRYERIVTATTDGVCLLDRTYTYQIVNQAYLTWHNKSKEQVIGHTVAEVLGAELFETRLKPQLDQCFIGKIVQYELWVDYPLQGAQFLSVTYVPYYDGAQVLAGAVVTLRNLTELKQTELSLQYSEKRLQMALEASGDGLWDWNIETGHVYYSPRYLEMLGYTVGELSETLETWDYLTHPDDKGWVRDRLKAHFQDDAVLYAFDYRVRTKDGGWKWVADYGKVVARDAAGKPLRMIGTHRDITDRKQQELLLQQAKEIAEMANQSKSMFLANMSHELRTPLNVILGFTQVMHRDATLSIDQQDIIQTIHRSGEHLLTLINDILDLSKIEAGQTTIEAVSFDLVVLLRSLESMLRHRAESKGLQLQLEIAPDVPTYITTDVTKLRQILINLLGNAIKFTQAGTVSLRVCLEDQTAAQSSSAQLPAAQLPAAQSPAAQSLMILHFTVADTGVGIAPQDIDTIFDAFVQSQAGRTATEGTGLGLTISRRFTELLGGELAVDSVPKQGSTFHMRLPVQVAEAIEVSAPEPQQQVIGLAPDQPNYRILVVDDQLENRQLLTRLMTRLGFQVQQASSGQEAIALWQQWRPHLVWMDLRMHAMDGYEATQHIRSSEADLAISTPNATKIIALTAQVATRDRHAALAAGCNDFVTKPFREQELYDKLAKHLNLRFQYAERKKFTDATAQLPVLSPSCITPESLSIMPPDWIHALYEATLSCDEEDTKYLIQQIPESHSLLTNRLMEWLRNYQFDHIKRLIQENKIYHTNTNSNR